VIFFVNCFVNFLAHAYLSFEEPEVLTGNMISDFVKGKKKFDYSPRIQEGIALHRAIDAFTDGNAITKEAVHLFRQAYGPYGLAFMDVVYDHFLAVELAAREKDFFKDFVDSTYQKIGLYDAVLPPAFKSMFPYMKEQNWLFNYQFTWGMAKSFEGLVHRARYISESAPALLIFEENYLKLKEAYNNFFPDVLNFSLEKFADIH
jgi:acyl carrier protein phosphodiesterase